MVLKVFGDFGGCGFWRLWFLEEIGHQKRQTNWEAVAPIVGVTGVNACAKVEVVGVVVVRVWSR